MNYDLAIAYRVYPGISKTPIIHGDDKLALTRFGLESLQLALSGVNARLLAILDGCPDTYEHLIDELFPGPGTTITHAGGVGNFATFGMQAQWLLEQEASDTVFFAEDDYYYRPGTFTSMLDFLHSGDDIDFITPYEHPDYYRRAMHRYRKQPREYDGHAWQKVSSTCLTFMTSRQTLRSTWPVFESYCRGVRDSSVWTALTRFPPHPSNAGVFLKALRFLPRQVLLGPGYKLWCPTPGFATHLESAHIAPGFEKELV